MLGLLLERREFVHQARASLTPEDFQNPATRKALERLFETGAAEESVSAAHLINFYNGNPELARVLSLAAAEADSTPEKERAFGDCLLWMKRSRLKGQRERIHSQLLEAQHEGNKNRIQQLLRDFSELNKGIKKSK